MQSKAPSFAESFQTDFIYPQPAVNHRSRLQGQNASCSWPEIEAQCVGHCGAGAVQNAYEFVLSWRTRRYSRLRHFKRAIFRKYRDMAEGVRRILAAVLVFHFVS